MSFKKRVPKNTNKRRRDDNEKDNEVEEVQDETEELVARTKLVQQGRNRSKGLDITSGASKRRKREDDSDFASLKFGMNHFQPQVDLPEQLKQKMEDYIVDHLKSNPHTTEEKSTSSRTTETKS